MDFYKTIQGRRSVRKFKQTPVTKELFEKIFEVALWAPSGKNLQNWKFIVLAGEPKDQLMNICSAGFQSALPGLQQHFAHKPKIIEAMQRFYQKMGGAPVIVCAYFEPGGEEELTSYQSVAAAIQNLLLVAYAEGLGSCWLTGPVRMADAIDHFLGVNDLTLVALVAMGYANETPRVPPRRPGRVDYRGF